jgi:rfaE bifunctional protein nucleotidyltransferase chain/domain
LKVLVTTNGCFDMLHVGHVRGLKAARQLGDMLVVGMNSDRSVATYKPGRPIIPQDERKELLESLGCVTRVDVMDDAHVWLESVARVRSSECAHVHVKGSEWEGKLPEAELDVVKRYGIQLVFMARPEGGISTSALIRKIQSLSP